ncbi:hypothetical protein HOG21_01990 [bacterium]|nr:hypothetical protein [bacterium]
MANATDVFFELIKIEEAEDKTLVFDENNKKVVYDKTDEYNSDNSVLQNYVGFKDLSVRSSA